MKAIRQQNQITKMYHSSNKFAFDHLISTKNYQSILCISF